MIKNFSVGNFKSFKDVVTLDMSPTSITELRETNVFSTKKNIDLLKSAVIYGANSSGKSNLIKAMSFMVNFVKDSSKGTQINDSILVDSFKLNSQTKNKPSYFEIQFIQNDIPFRYGFTANTKEIINEWLFFTPNVKELELFTRDKSNFKISNRFKEAKKLEEKTRPNALFLSVVAQFNGEISLQIMEWFNSIIVSSGLNDSEFSNYTLDKIDDKKYKNLIINFLRTANTDIEGINKEIREVDLNKVDLDKFKMPKEVIDFMFPNKSVKIPVISTLHKFFDNEKFTSLVSSSLDSESEGTKKLFYLSGPILETLEKGHILIIDELDSRLHPIITKFIVELFQSKDVNKNKAQLIFATHNTNLLDISLFRRDQIWFTEKDRYESTNLYSLSEYKIEGNKKIRKDASISKDYINGKYGAIPFLGDISLLLK